MFLESCPSWSKEHDWKSCNRQKRFVGSNPMLSAKTKRASQDAFFVMAIRSKGIRSGEVVYPSEKVMFHSPALFNSFFIRFTSGSRMNITLFPEMIYA